MHLPERPAIALVELSSIARALRVGDAMVKRAPVTVVRAETTSPGKFLILIAGDEASVEESWKVGREAAGEALVDELFLAAIHVDAYRAVMGASAAAGPEDSLGAFETKTVASAILASDAALKCAPVALVEIRLGDGIGGKGVFSIAGALDDVMAALDAAERAIEARRALIAREIVPRPDPAFSLKLARS